MPLTVKKRYIQSQISLGLEQKKNLRPGGPEEIFTVIVFRIEIVFECVVFRIQLSVSSIPIV